MGFLEAEKCGANRLCIALIRQVEPTAFTSAPGRPPESSTISGSRLSSARIALSGVDRRHPAFTSTPERQPDSASPQHLDSQWPRIAGATRSSQSRSSGTCSTSRSSLSTPTETKEPPGGVAWPKSFEPQHSTEPSVLNPQVCNHPALTWAKEPPGGVAAGH